MHASSDTPVRSPAGESEADSGAEGAAVKEEKDEDGAPCLQASDPSAFLDDAAGSHAAGRSAESSLDSEEAVDIARRLEDLSEDDFEPDDPEALQAEALAVKE